jgi:hypothetical protein
MPLNVPSELLYTAGQSLAASEKYRQTDRHSDGISSIAMPTSDRTAEKTVKWPADPFAAIF